MPNSPRPRRKRSQRHRRRPRPPPPRPRLLPSRPLRYIEISEGLLESSLKSKVTNRRCRCQGGEIGRRARLRIAKPSISEPCFSLQLVTRFTRGKRLVSRKSSNSRMASRKRFDLAQILAPKRARLRLWSPGFFATTPPLRDDESTRWLNGFKSS